MSVLTLQYECHYGMNGIMMWMTLQYEWHYSVNGTTVWMAPQNEWRHSMNDTTVLITSVNTCNCPQEITWLFLVSPGNSVQFPWQLRYTHLAEWRQADSREDGRQRGRDSAVTWPHGGEHGVWGKQPVSDVMAITAMLIIWRNLKSVWQWFILLSLFDNDSFYCRYGCRVKSAVYSNTKASIWKQAVLRCTV